MTKKISGSDAITKDYLDEKIDGLKDEFTGLKNEVNGLKGKLNGLKDEFNGLRSEFSGLRSEFSGLKDDFSGLKSEFTGLRGEFAAFREEIRIEIKETVTSAMDKLYTRIDPILAEVKNARIDRELTSDRLEDHKKRIKKLETRN